MGDEKRSGPGVESGASSRHLGETNSSILAEALAQVEQGRVVVPACTSPCTAPWHDPPCPGKRPLVKIKDRDTVTAEEVRRWWRRWPEAQLALLTGARSGLVVIDLDGPEGERSLAKLEQVLVVLPYTTEVKTRHGRHLYFRHPGNGTKILTRKGPQFTTWNEIPEPAPGLDVRGDGGLVIAPPSANRAYVNDLEPAELPCEWIGPLSTSSSQAREVDTEQAREWLTDGEPDQAVAEALKSYDGHRDGARRLQVELLGLGHDGHPGTAAAMDQLRERYLVDHDAHDWDRLLAGAPGQVQVMPDIEELAKKHSLADDDGPSLDELLDNYARRLEAKAEERKKDPAQTKADNKEQAIRQELERLIVRDAAKRRYQAMEAAQLPDPVLTRLTDLLDEPDDDPTYRIDGLWPTGGNIILAAARKSGKTTTVGNLVRCLVDGDPFLGRGDAMVQAGGFDVEPVDGMVALLDLELDRRMMRRWLRDQAIGKRDQVMAESLRGKAHLFDVLDDKRRGKWAELLAQYRVQVLILDPLGALLDAYGRDENSNSDVGPVLQALDQLKAEAGVQELLLAHHMGHNGERSRGASKLRGWPDAEWFLVRERAAAGEEPPPDAARFFLAEGRDVMVPETRIQYDASTRRLFIAGGNRVQHQATKHGPKLLEIIEQNPGQSGREIIDAAMAAGIPKHATEAALRKLVKDGQVRTETGPKRAKLHYLAEEQDQAEEPKLDPFAGKVTGP
jgi:Bifunctional DNA primase/polymerase, N-terminal/AAA domain